MNALPVTGELFATNLVSPEGERCYKYQLGNFAQWMCYSRSVADMEDVTTADLLAYRQSLQHLAGSTQKLYLAAIKSFFEWTLEAGIITTNPAASLKLSKSVRNKAPVFLTLDETRLLWASVTDGSREGQQGQNTTDQPSGLRRYFFICISPYGWCCIPRTEWNPSNGYEGDTSAFQKAGARSGNARRKKVSALYAAWVRDAYAV